MILTAWLTAGRTAESAFLSWDNTFYDAYFNCAYISIYQWKVDGSLRRGGGCMWLCRGPRRPSQGSPPGPSARRAVPRMARTSVGSRKSLSSLFFFGKHCVPVRASGTFKDQINPKRQTAFPPVGPGVGDQRNWTSLSS